MVLKVKNPDKEHKMEDKQNKEKPSAPESKHKFTFEKLTPAYLSDDEMQGYTEALDFVFQEDDLLNIAVTGPYASGKSSVIKTYEENHKKLNGIHISLSYFSPILASKIKGKKNGNELAFEDELMLERKIINQLIHQIEPHKIPATDFKVKNELSKWLKLTWAGIVSLIIFCLIYINETLLTKLLNEYTTITLVLMGVSFILIGFIAFKIIDQQSGKSLIRKLKVFENEIDISSSECDVSYFDKYLNEIIYILDKSKLDYIVLEDIDRYDDNLILSKLRELNYIYNKKQSKNRPKPIKFIYLIKDEIFESKERTKFFDYILPIVPVMDNSNSLGKMEKLFKNQNIYSDFTSSFLDILSDYLDDIRLIKNICNEYKIYKTKIAHDSKWFKYENLLAIIIYKNIFPEDFSLTRLGLGQGVVHRIIESLKIQKNIIYETEIEKINNRIKMRKENINSIETSHLKNLDELDALFINIPWNIKKDYNYIDGVDIFTLNAKDFIHTLKENNLTISNYRPRDDYYYREHNCQQYFNNLETNSEYQERKEEIEFITTHKKSTLEAEIKNLKKERFNLQLPKKINEVIAINLKNGISANTLFQKHFSEKTPDTSENEKYKKYKEEYEKLSASCYFPLLRVLIIQGYIDEYYSDYTSFLDKEGLPQNDTLFLRNIYEYTENDWELELKKPEIVLQRLNLDNSNKFKGRAILNYSLLDYILLNNKTDDLYKFNILLKSYNETDFANEYLARYYALLINQDAGYDQKYLCLLIKELNIQIWDIWKYIDMFNMKLYLYLSFISNRPIELKGMNEDDDLKNFITHSTDFLLIDDEWNTIFELIDENQNNLRKIANAFVILDIQFKQIDNSKPELLELVEKNNSYKLTYTNVKHILANQYSLTNCDSNIIQTVLALNDDAPIKSYFQSNTEALIISITESDVSIIDDNEETALFILNHDDISVSAKIAYINKLSTIIDNLTQATDKDIWNKLLENQKIEYSAENIVHYFFNYELEDDNNIEKREINEQLANFINHSDKNISSEDACLNKLITEEDEIDLFFSQTIINPSLNDTKYSMLISWFNGKYYYNFDYKNIDKAKISILNKYKVIKLSHEQDLNFLRENYPENILEIITNNFESYVAKLNDDNALISHEEIVDLLSEDLSLKQKQLLLNFTDEPISIIDKNYVEEIQKNILEKNFDIDDLVYVTSEEFYNSANNQIKDIIKNLCIEHKTEILQFKQISKVLLVALLKLTQLSLDDKYTILCNQIYQLNTDEIFNTFKIIEQEPANQSFFSSLFIAKRPSFEYTELNLKIMKNLYEKWQFKFNIEGDKIISFGKKMI